VIKLRKGLHETMNVWYNEIIAEIIKNGDTVLQTAHLIDLLERVEPLLEIRKEYKDTTGGDTTALGDKNTDESHISVQYDKQARHDDPALPVQQLLLGYTGCSVTTETYRNILWRLSAGRETMARREFLLPALPTTGEPDSFWEGLFIESCGYAPPTAKGKLQLALSFRIMGGKYAGLRFEQNIPYFMVIFKIAKEIGFPKYKRTHYNELVKCVFIGNVVFEKRGGRLLPRVSEYHVTSAVKNLNTKLRKERAEPCKYIDYTWACHKCSCGYDDMESGRCERAVRPDALVRKPCPQCQKNSFFDANSTSAVCVGCQALPYKLLER